MGSGTSSRSHRMLNRGRKSLQIQAASPNCTACPAATLQCHHYCPEFCPLPSLKHAVMSSCPRRSTLGQVLLSLLLIHMCAADCVLSKFFIATARRLRSGFAAAATGVGGERPGISQETKQVRTCRSEPTVVVCCVSPLAFTGTCMPPCPCPHHCLHVSCLPPSSAERDRAPLRRRSRNGRRAWALALVPPGRKGRV